MITKPTPPIITRVTKNVIKYVAAIFMPFFAIAKPPVACVSLVVTQKTSHLCKRSLVSWNSCITSSSPLSEWITASLSLILLLTPRGNVRFAVLISAAVKAALYFHLSPVLCKNGEYIHLRCTVEKCGSLGCNEHDNTVRIGYDAPDALCSRDVPQCLD